jgi:hypothetical protein
MTSIRRDIPLDVPAATAWAMLADVGAAHRPFAGVLSDCRLDGDVRTVTFANGAALRERIIDIDPAAMRVAYAVIGSGFEHHSASMQIVPDGDRRCRFVWVSDFLPEAKRAVVEPLVDAGCAALKRVLEAGA